MPVLVPGKPIATGSPTLLVENGLAPGTHRFSLVVVDTAGNESAPAVIEVRVNAPLRPVIPAGRVILERDVLSPIITPLRPGSPP
jgi:hypothetical protein